MKKILIICLGLSFSSAMFAECDVVVLSDASEDQIVVPAVMDVPKPISFDIFKGIAAESIVINDVIPVITTHVSAKASACGYAVDTHTQPAQFG